VRPVVILLILTFLFIIGLGITIILGCGDHYVSTDILVSKYDSGGGNSWNITIDRGKNDYATAVIETSDGGYAVAGWIEGQKTGLDNPRVIRLDRTGRILWDRTLDDSRSYSLAIAEAPDGGFVIAQNINNKDRGRIVRITAGGDPVWNVTMDSDFKDIVPAGNGRFILAGSRTVIIDGNGTIVQEPAVPSTSVLPASDGGFYLGRIGTPHYTIASVFRIDENGTVIWTKQIGDSISGTISSLHETPAGDLEVLSTYRIPYYDRETAMYMQSDFMTIGTDGNISETRPVVAVDPVCRTTDGGFAFIAYPFPGSAAYTSIPDSGSTLHMVRLSQEGSIIDDRPLGIHPWVNPKEIIQTRDGGFLTVVMLGH